MKKTLAKQFIVNYEKPLLFTEEVQAITGLSSADVRTLFNRNHLCLHYTPPAGRGFKLQYPMFDVMEIMSYAELSKLGVRPTFTRSWKSDTPIAIGIANCIMDHIRAISGETKPRLRAIPGVKDPEEIPPGSERYVLVYYDNDFDGVWPIWAADALMNIPEAGHARVVIDCLAMALQSLEIFRQYKSRL